MAEPDAYASASRPCDIVMKGGAASGFVYARALTVLAKTYRIQSVGGTSAGAGAAGVAAAAEYGRRKGGVGYAGIENIPEWAGEIVAPSGWTRLKHLFGPDESTRRVYAVVTAMFPMLPYWWLRAARTALRSYWGWSLAGFLIALPMLVGLMAQPWPDAPLAIAVRMVGALVAAVLAVGLVAGLAGWGALRDASRALPANGFGLCSAFDGGKPAPAEKMTDWLYGLYQRLAGLPFERPLTFGDLQGALDEQTRRGIELNVMSINVTLGRPYRLPFKDDDEPYWFSPAEFRRLFPEPVVKAMEDAGRRMPRADQFAAKGLLPFPRRAEVPIMVAVRMSYALPILFSTVPLWSIDRSRQPDRQARGESVAEPAPERCYFIDGALASNFPVHLFDSPLPRWPTFAINLRKFHPDWRKAGEPRHDAWLDDDFVVSGDRGLLREWWTRIDHDAVPGDPTRFQPVDDATRFKRFLGAALATMMNWVDNQQLRLPGYRDRVANVSLADDEGGGHFDMDAKKIKRIADRGGLAADKLVRHYTDGTGPGPGWNRHRWTRYVTSIQLAAKFVEGFERGYATPLAGDKPYPAILADAACVPAGCDPLAPGQRDVAEQLARGLIAEEQRLPEDTDRNWPRHPAIAPEPVLRLLPDM
jgi:predicted acylesterase/phospholipase RssA